jgi:hypothetical protein
MADSSAVAWSVHELGLADFGDKRLTQRGVELASSLLEHPQHSIPQACQSWAATKGAYRFFSNDKVQSGKMLNAHQVQLRQLATDFDTVLVAQDTTTLNLSNKQIAGVGSIGNGGNGGSNGGLKGLYVHTALAMSPDGVPLGVTSQKTYARKAETKTASYKQTVKGRPITEKETFRWVEAVTAAKAVLPDKHVVVVGDRESDIFEVFNQGRSLGVDLLVRTNQNRLLTEAGETVRLFDKARQGNIVTRYETDVPVDHHKTRKAVLTIRGSSMLLPPPKSRSRKEAWTSIPLTVLNVMEENPPADVEPIHWLLTTSLSVTTAAEAREKVTWYMYRWRIERFFYTLKTGAFNIEKLQFETFSRFAKAITMYSLVACRLLRTLYYERDHPLETAENFFSHNELQALQLREKRRGGVFTIHEAVMAIAKLGGHLGRKSDGPPGIKAVWTGFQALQYLVEGMLLGSQMEAQGLL